MALANVSISTSTFFEWVVRTNQLIVIANSLTEGQANSTGTLKLSGQDGDGVGLNVSSGIIKGDGGLVTNVQTASLSVNSFSLVSNSATITVEGGSNAELGGTIYLEIGTLSTDVDDTSVANIASANIVNVAHQTAIAAFAAANSAVTDYSPAFDKANTAFDNAANNTITAGAAFDKANTANVNAANASFMSTGTVLSARMTGGYTGITETGTLTALNVSSVIRSTSGGFEFPNGNTISNWTVSASDPTGGSDGDVWIKITS